MRRIHVTFTAIAIATSLTSCGPNAAENAMREQSLALPARITQAVAPHGPTTNGQIVVGCTKIYSRDGRIIFFPPSRREWEFQFSKHLYDPTAFAYDGYNYLYAANYSKRPGQGNVVEFWRGNEFIYTKGISAPKALAVDSANILYVANNDGLYQNSVVAYDTANKQLIETITAGIDGPTSISTDAQRNLYVANSGSNSVTVYAPGTNVPSYTITDGIAAPNSIALDTSGNLYVSNNASNSISVYAPDAATPSYTITDGVSAPTAITFDRKGNLYVANQAAGTGSVTEYSAGSQFVRRTFSDHVRGPTAIAVDGEGDLYVLDGGNLLFFRHKSTNFVMYLYGQGRCDNISLTYNFG